MSNSKSEKNFNNLSYKVFIRTFGCQMNVRDSEVIGGLLLKKGFQLTDNEKEADIFIFNTCSVRQHAEDKVWSEIGKLRKSRVQSPESREKKLQTTPIIGIVGCMAKNYGEEVFKRAPQVDFVTGPNDIDKIPQILEEMVKFKAPVTKKICQTNGRIRPEEIYHTDFREDKNHAYVVISEGCSNRCSYCVVPYVRGELVCRNFKDILREIKETVDKGIFKITLLGQNVNSYQYENVDFIKLLQLVNEIKGLEEFSFITSHPKDTKIELFKVMADSEKLKKYLHLPVQSGSDKILELMNRGYNRRFYLDLIQSYRKIVKDGVLSTDIITGFPRETESDFQDTYNLLKDIQFNSAYIFKYSLRPHTEAFKLGDDVPKREKERRHKILLDLQIKISNKIKIGK